MNFDLIFFFWVLYLCKANICKVDMGHNTHLSKTEIHRIMQQDDKAWQVAEAGRKQGDSTGDIP